MSEFDPFLSELSKEQIEEDENKEKTKGLTQILARSLSLQQIFSIVISLVIYFIFGYLSTFSEIISHLILDQTFILDSHSLLTFVINLVLFLLVILFIIYIPRLDRERLNSFFALIGGIISGLIVYAVTITYCPSRLLFFGNPFHYSFFTLPLLFIIGAEFYTYKKLKHSHFMKRILNYLLGFCLILIIVDLHDFQYLLAILMNDPLTVILLFVFYNVLFLYFIQKRPYKETSYESKQTIYKIGDIK